MGLEAMPSGSYPFAGGLHETGYLTKPWTIRQLAGLASADGTNERFKYLLGLGETGLSLAFDLPTQHGIDPGDPRSLGEVGRAGVSVSTVDDLKRIFEGIDLAQVSVSFTINATAPMIAAMWVVAAEETGTPRGELRGTVQNEMLKEFLARKATIYDIDTSMRFSVDLIEWARCELPRVSPVSISGGHVREAGCTRELEVACAIADAEEYLRLLSHRGLGTDEVAPIFSFLLGTHMELLAEAAKFRAARRLYAQRMRDRWGAQLKKSQTMRIQVNTYGSALAAQEPLNNIVRATVQAIAGVLGQVQSMHVCAFDEAHRTPSELSARVALRTQQILLQETDLARHVDPLGGSQVIDALADDIEAGALRWLSQIEEQGGMTAVIRSGWLESVVEEMAAEAPTPVVGLPGGSPNEAERGLVQRDAGPTRADGLPAEQRATPADDVTECLLQLRQDCEAGLNIMPALISAARARASIGAMTDALRPSEECRA